MNALPHKNITYVYKRKINLKNAATQGSSLQGQAQCNGMLVMYHDAVNKNNGKKQYWSYCQGVINNQQIYKNVSKVIAVFKNSYCRTIYASIFESSNS